MYINVKLLGLTFWPLCSKKHVLTIQISKEVTNIDNDIMPAESVSLQR